MPHFAKVESGVITQICYAGAEGTPAPDGYVEVPPNARTGQPIAEAQAVEYPDSIILKDQVTGEPVKVQVSNGNAYVGDMEDETPS